MRVTCTFESYGLHSPFSVSNRPILTQSGHSESESKHRRGARQNGCIGVPRQRSTYLKPPSLQHSLLFSRLHESLDDGRDQIQRLRSTSHKREHRCAGPKILPVARFAQRTILHDSEPCARADTRSQSHLSYVGIPEIRKSPFLG